MLDTIFAFQLIRTYYEDAGKKFDSKEKDDTYSQTEKRTKSVSVLHSQFKVLK